MKCATHPDVETSLRCGKCGKPICPKCMVQTPVGARCRDCAGLYKLPTYRVSGTHYLRAAGAAVAGGGVTGLIWGAIGMVLPFYFLNLLLAAGIGYGIGELVGLSVNRKRGKWLAVIGSIGVVIAYVVSVTVFMNPPFGIIPLIVDLVGLGAGIYMAVNRLR